jgi:hypothetical protein
MATGFSYHYGFRHPQPVLRLWSGLSLHPMQRMSPVKSLHLLSEKSLARDCHVFTEVSPNLSDSTSLITEGALKFFLIYF